MDKIIKIKNMLVSKQFICFIVIGGINSLSSIVFSWIYTGIMPPVIAFIPGYMTGVGISYSLNSYFTFKEKFSLKSFFKFMISTIPNFLIQLITVFVIVNRLEMDAVIAYALAAVIGVPVTFIILKLFVFIKK